ncbi:winged helix-turn-helix transcriptional regulator [Synechocystis salina LEGE 06099]|uniref:ArsR/SmtB family transcription factor n=1 Tax=Synechocystis salina TaxID=945780 RepID=UPI001880207B|nr:metalloregulator ArsR/SmtB family transcription factor [Synechocystis salina]MBE9203613.1 winged helix-turn-helix transcriptional regulator [Synechocystis salina LEGE 06099]
MKPTEKDLISTGFHALSDPIRLQVLTLLENQEQCVCDLCEQLTISQSKLSFHLKRLRDAELVHTRQEGRWIYYRLNPDQFYRLRHYLDSYGQAIQDYGTRHCCE